MCNLNKNDINEKKQSCCVDNKIIVWLLIGSIVSIVILEIIVFAFLFLKSNNSNSILFCKIICITLVIIVSTICITILVKSLINCSCKGRETNSLKDGNKELLDYLFNNKENENR